MTAQRSPATAGGGDLAVRELTIDAGEVRARLSLAGQQREVRYRAEGVNLERAVDALAVALLPAAMSRGLAIELPGRLSPRLGESLASAQAVLEGWWGRIEGWSRVELREGPGPAPPAAQKERGVACFFTGGVDSFHSVLTALEDLDAVVFVHGFDVALADTAKRALVSASLREAAGELGLELIEVESDVKQLTWSRCKWGFHAHGAALASVGHLLSGRFREMLVPASHTYRDLFPWGSHALLDPLWSSESVRFIHHAPLARTRKVARIARSDTALAHLRCCFERTTPGELNCGHCEKCLRTMASLRIVGALDRCATLPQELPLSEVRRMPLPSRGWEALVDDLATEADAAGDLPLARALRTALRVGPLVARGERAAGGLRMRAARRTRRARRRWRRARRRLGRRARRLAPSRGDGAFVPPRGTPARGTKPEADPVIRAAVLPAERAAMIAVLEPEGLTPIPSPEMDDFDVGHWLVAELDGRVVGVAGFEIDRNGDGTIGRNLILAVLERHRGRGIGRALVEHRLGLMLAAGVETVRTNTDRPELIAWLKRDYGYRKVGEVRKLHRFGRADVDVWTTLEVPIDRAAAGLGHEGEARRALARAAG